MYNVHFHELKLSARVPIFFKLSDRCREVWANRVKGSVL